MDDNFNEAFSIIVIRIKKILSNGLNRNVRSARGQMMKVISGTKYRLINGDNKFSSKKLLMMIGAPTKKAITEITSVLEKYDLYLFMMFLNARR